VQRPRLAQRLNEGLEAGRKVTLVSAPAGFGKTTCVMDWLDTMRSRPAAWLTLDPADDEPARFFAYFATALQKIHPGVGRAVLGALESGSLPPVDLLIAQILNDIPPGCAPFLLALDDFHVLRNPALLQAVERWIALQPPTMHLVLLTREDPPMALARLRANNLLTEIRAEELRFSAEEAALFLQDCMGLALADTEVRLLDARTEGWVVGLQLASLALRPQPGAPPPPVRSGEQTAFLARLSGSRRFILSYLTEEVLNRQPKDVREFLLKTSILDRLTGDLCDALTGRSGSAALLEQLTGANLFLTRLDAEQPWYRFHPLFADLLRSHFKQHSPHEALRDLHQRASRWFAAAASQAAAQSGQPGERAALAGQAIQHALAAFDPAFAVELVETHALDLLNQWYIRTVAEWMRALPPDWTAASPQANLAFARVHLVRGEISQAGPYLERLHTRFSTSPELPPALRASWLALQSTLLGAQGLVQESAAVASQAVTVAGQAVAGSAAELPANRVAHEAASSALAYGYLALASAYQGMGETDRAMQAYQKLTDLGRASGSLISELLGASALALLYIQRGQIHQAYHLALLAVERAESAGTMPPILSAIYGELGTITFHWFQLDLAEQYIQRSAQIAALGSFSDAALYYAVFRSRLCLMQDDAAGAAREVAAAARQMQADAPTVVREEVVAQQVNVLLAQGAVEQAQHLLVEESLRLFGQPRLPQPDGPIAFDHGVLYLASLRYLLVQAQHTRQEDGTGLTPTGALAEGLRLAGRLVDALLAQQFLALALEALLTRAQLQAAAGNPQASLADVSLALDLAEPEGLIDIFVWAAIWMPGAPLVQALRQLRQAESHTAFIERILAAFPRKAAPSIGPSAGLPEPLTAREREVLELIAQGSSYAEIAVRLVVSINTVRTHIKAIYSKLDARDRLSAVETARRRGVL
jgi:LuxR family maltose regulon positive regulatory protein